MIKLNVWEGFVPSYSSQSLEADVLKFFLNRTNNLITGVDSFLSEDQNCGFADGLCADTQWGKYNDIVIVDTDRQADVTSVDFLKNKIASDQYDVSIGTQTETETQKTLRMSHPQRRIKTRTRTLTVKTTKKNPNTQWKCNGVGLFSITPSTLCLQIYLFAREATPKCKLII